MARCSSSLSTRTPFFVPCSFTHASVGVSFEIVTSFSLFLQLDARAT